MPPNSTLLTDTYTSPLRAQHGAAERERWNASNGFAHETPNEEELG